MTLTGEQIIDAIAARLTERGVRCYDTEIIIALRGLTAQEIAQLVNLGDVIQWHNERMIDAGDHVAALDNDTSGRHQ